MGDGLFKMSHFPSIRCYDLLGPRVPVKGQQVRRVTRQALNHSLVRHLLKLVACLGAFDAFLRHEDRP